jgi:hypothetical protein
MERTQLGRKTRCQIEHWHPQRALTATMLLAQTSRDMFVL